MTSPAHAVAGALATRLRRGDDETLWRLVVDQALADVDEAAGDPDHGIRRLVLVFACVPARAPDLHPDDAAHWQAHFTRERHGDVWTEEPGHPRFQRRRGHYRATVCVPAGSARLALAEVTVLWRPRLPWAPPQDTEMGRVEYLFTRDPDSTWRFRSRR